MNTQNELAEYSDAEFAEFERNHMYPPGYGKDTNMIKPKNRHVSAITRSIHLLENGLADEIEKRFHRHMVVDIGLLTEVKTMLFRMIENPTLPFVESAVPELAEAVSQDIPEIQGDDEPSVLDLAETVAKNFPQIEDDGKPDGL